MWSSRWPLSSCASLLQSTFPGRAPSTGAGGWRSEQLSCPQPGPQGSFRNVSVSMCDDLPGCLRGTLDGAQSCLLPSLLQPPPLFLMFLLCCVFCAAGMLRKSWGLSSQCHKTDPLSLPRQLPHLTTKDYAEMYKVIKTVKRVLISQPGPRSLPSGGRAR